MKLIDLTGQRFGELVVLEKVGRHQGSKALVPCSSVFAGVLPADPFLPPCCAWIDFRHAGGPHSLCLGGATEKEALERLEAALPVFLASPEAPKEAPKEEAEDF